MKSIPLCPLLVSMALVGCNPDKPADVAPAASAPVTQPMEVPPAAAVGPAQAAPPRLRSRAAAPSYNANEPQVEPTYSPAPIYSDYRPAISQPVPIAVPWAPPPMRVEAPPPPPSDDARWTGGYWVWRDNWVWAPGRWAEPPRPQYHWVPPYYEHRQDRVVFVDGFWSPPGVSFEPPARNLTIALAVIGAGIALGRAPVGPEGVFVPPPPGSRPGLFVMAPIGTAPAVVTGAPPIGAPGMRVSNHVDNTRITNTVNNTTTINRNTTVVNNITHVTIEAPAGSTLDHRPVRVSVPAEAHLAAALPPIAASPQSRPSPEVPARESEPPTRPGSPSTATRHVEPPSAGRVAPASTPPPVPTLPPRVERAPPPTPTHGDNESNTRAEPGERTVPPKAAPVPVAPARAVATPPPPPPKIPVESRPQERPLPATPNAPRNREAPRGEAPHGDTPHGHSQPPPARAPDARPEEAHPPDRPAPASVAKPKGEPPKAEEAKKGVDAREEAVKKKERETKGEPPHP